MKIDDRAVGLFTEEHFSLQMIGDFYGVSRQAVKKHLNLRGVDTSKKRLVVVCDSCGVEFAKPRCQVRLSIKNYCSVGCYYGSIKNPDYFVHRQGARNARKVVLECGYYLGEGEVVHHVDGNQDNNDPENLIVFKNNSDHMRWHRAGGVESGVVPVWPEMRVNDTNLQKGELKRLAPAEKKDRIVSDKISEDEEQRLRDALQKARNQAGLDKDREKLQRKKGETNAAWLIRKTAFANKNGPQEGK